MDHHVGDLHPLIVGAFSPAEAVSVLTRLDREIELIQGLLERVLVFDEAISHACDVCAELDCLLSLAEAARTYGYRRPDMVQENVIDIVQGRYTKLELCILCRAT